MSMSDTDYFNAACAAGYNAGTQALNPNLFSSRMWEAFELGRWMHHTGYPISRVSPSRGHSWRTANGAVIRITYGKDQKFKMERAQ